MLIVKPLTLKIFLWKWYIHLIPLPPKQIPKLVQQRVVPTGVRVIDVGEHTCA
jgi:hypothetical protein